MFVLQGNTLWRNFDTVKYFFQEGLESLYFEGRAINKKKLFTRGGISLLLCYHMINDVVEKIFKMR